MKLSIANMHLLIQGETTDNLKNKKSFEFYRSNDNHVFIHHDTTTKTIMQIDSTSITVTEIDNAADTILIDTEDVEQDTFDIKYAYSVFEYCILRLHITTMKITAIDTAVTKELRRSIEELRRNPTKNTYHNILTIRSIEQIIASVNNVRAIA